MDVLDMMGGNPFSSSGYELSAFDYSKAAEYEFDRYGGFEVAKVSEFESESISLFSTNARSRDFDRRKVNHCGEVPRVGQRVLICKRTYNDTPVSVGISSWATE